MADYIDREVLRTYMLTVISLAETFNKDGRLDDKIDVYKKCLSIVNDDMPSVDAVEVVRCKDCKYRETTNIGNFCQKICEIQDDASVYLEIYDNDYCKWGEKE